MRLASRFGRINQVRRDRPLTNDELATYVPSIFSEEKHESRSERYTYIPTITLLDNLRQEGFQPFYACQTRVRDEEKKGHTKHMLRLRRENQIIGKEVPEIVLLNSHDGSSSYQMIPGIFRFICANGMVCGDTFGEVRVPHKGDVVGQVIEGAYEVLGIFDKVDEQLDAMKSIRLNKDEQQLFAEASLLYRYGNEEGKSAPIAADKLLLPRRSEDRQDDLWMTFQRVQENMIKGGLIGRNASGKKSTTRAIKGIDGDVKLNRALWMIAEQFKNLKS